MMNIVKNVALWMLQLLLAAVFLRMARSWSLPLHR